MPHGKGEGTARGHRGRRIAPVATGAMQPTGTVPQETSPLLGSAGCPPSAVDPNDHPGVGAPPGGAGAAEEDRAPQPTWLEMMRFVYPYIVPGDFKHTGLVLVALVSVMLGKVTSLLPPLAIKSAIDTIARNASTPPGKAVAPLTAIAAYFGLVLLSRVINIAETMAHELVTLQAERRFAVAAFEHLHNLGLAYHLDRKTGEITHMMDRGARTISTLLDTALFSLLPTLFETVLVTAIFWKLGAPLIAVAVFVSVTVYVAFIVSVTKFRVRVRRSLNEADDAVENKAVETLINYETVSMFARTRDEIRLYNSLRQNLQDQSINVRLVVSSLSFVQRTIQHIGLCVGLCLAGYGTVYGHPRLTSGDFVVIQMYINQLFSPLLYLGYTYRAVVNAFTDLEKTMAVLARKPQISDAADACDWIPTVRGTESIPQGELEFTNVTFHYGTSSRAAGGRDGGGGVSNISFRADAGKVIALVGKSGSGKSTLIRLALRLYDVDEGTITVDGRDITSLTQESLRRNIGIVAQETVLFNDTLRYNIAYGKEGATDSEVWNAARAAALGEMIEGLPEKMDTRVGERGLKLSGGERQRVGIARCIIKGPAVLLFDEATSSLDSQTEKEIQTNLEEVCRNRTAIVIAHRLSTITRADEIILLDGGSVKERGTHAELLALGGTYAEMWKYQSE